MIIFGKVTISAIVIAVIIYLVLMYCIAPIFKKKDLKKVFEKSAKDISSECKLLIKWLMKNDIRVWIEDGQITFDPPNTKVPKKIKQLIIEHKAELVTFLEKWDDIDEARALYGHLPRVGRHPRR